MKKYRKILLAALIVALIACLSATPALAYFTTSTSAGGGVSLDIDKPSTDVEEPDVIDHTKHIIIANTGFQDVFVRARAFSGYEGLECYGDGWTAGDDGWYYYDDVLTAAGSGSEASAASEFFVNYEAVEQQIGTPAEGDNFNVVVVYEATPAQYTTVNGVTTANPDWSFTLNSGN